LIVFVIPSLLTHQNAPVFPAAILRHDAFDRFLPVFEFDISYTDQQKTLRLYVNQTSFDKLPVNKD